MDLVLTTAWRAAGWIPMHVGTVVKDGCCALLAAPSTGGKSTLTAAMLHRGWYSLGDDKALLKRDPDGRTVVRALQLDLHLDPQTQRWFPEVGDLSVLPRRSLWTQKRRLRIEAIWPGRTLTGAVPTHLIQIQRCPERRPAQVIPLTATQCLSVLLRQTVVPAEPAMAKEVLATVAPVARQLRGLRLELGDDAYSDPAVLAMVEQALL